MLLVSLRRIRSPWEIGRSDRGGVDERRLPCHQVGHEIPRALADAEAMPGEVAGDIEAGQGADVGDDGNTNTVGRRVDDTCPALCDPHAAKRRKRNPPRSRRPCGWRHSRWPRSPSPARRRRRLACRAPLPSAATSRGGADRSHQAQSGGSRSDRTELARAMPRGPRLASPSCRIRRCRSGETPSPRPPVHSSPPTGACS